MSRNMFRRLLYSIAIVLAWLGFVVEGSHALLTDSVTLAGNSLVTGTADLQISNSQNETSTLFADSRPGFSYVLSPGQSDERYIFLKNASAAPIALDLTAQTALQAPIVGLANQVSLEFTPVDSSGVATGSPVKGVVGEMNGPPMTLGVSIPQGTTQRFKVKVQLNQGVIDQGATLAYDLIFYGTQHLPT